MKLEKKKKKRGDSENFEILENVTCLQAAALTFLSMYKKVSQCHISRLVRITEFLQCTTECSDYGYYKTSLKS